MMVGGGFCKPQSNLLSFEVLDQGNCFTCHCQVDHYFVFAQSPVAVRATNATSRIGKGQSDSEFQCIKQAIQVGVVGLQARGNGSEFQLRSQSLAADQLTSGLSIYQGSWKRELVRQFPPPTTMPPTFTYEFNNASFKGKSFFETGVFIDGKFVDGSDKTTIE